VVAARGVFGETPKMAAGTPALPHKTEFEVRCTTPVNRLRRLAHHHPPTINERAARQVETARCGASF
jgi:hypothetical protein